MGLLDHAASHLQDVKSLGILEPGGGLSNRRYDIKYHVLPRHCRRLSPTAECHIDY